MSKISGESRVKFLLGEGTWQLIIIGLFALLNITLIKASIYFYND